MSLRQQAETDLSFIIEDSINGFGWAVTLTNPDGLTGNFVSLTNDIAQLIDPDTGQAISGRQATICLRINSLLQSGLGLPKGVADTNTKPWIVTFNDVNGNNYTFKILQTNPDRAIGLVTCILENFTPL